MDKNLNTLNDINDLHFFGPFKFTRGSNYLFDSEYNKAEGVYIYTIKDELNERNLIHYIGETSSFAKRQREHLIQMTGLNYRILDPEKARQGIETTIWKGLWRDRTNAGVANLLDNYDTISQKVVEYIGLINVYFAPTTLPTDIRRHIEACIASNLRTNYPNLKTFYPDDNRTVMKKDRLGKTISITADEIISGLDTQLNI